MWRQLLIVPLCCCLADDTEGISLRAQKYKSESADQASYYIDLFLGTPYQKVRAQLDTGSDLLAVPATRESCAACSVPARLGGKVYNRAVSSTAAPLPCHSAECVHSRTEGLGNRTAVATVCPVKGRAGRISARALRSRWFSVELLSLTLLVNANWTPVRVPSCCCTRPCLAELLRVRLIGCAGISEGATELCADHLALPAREAQGDPASPCEKMLRYGFSCTADLAALELEGTILSDLCPETCGICQGVTRFCADSGSWRDADGRTCTQYAEGKPQHDSCFETDAYHACPVACLACGDCCTADDSCYFFSTYRDGTLLTGGKVKDKVHMGHPFLVLNHTTFAIFDHVNTDFQASGAVDGVLGLGSGSTCNPSCGPTFLDMLWDKNPNLPRLFALCLSQQAPLADSNFSGSIDVGHALEAHHDGPIRWVPMAAVDSPGHKGYKTVTGLLDIKLNDKSLVDNAPANGTGSFYATSEQLSGYRIEVDSGTTGILLPAALYGVFAVHLANSFS